MAEVLSPITAANDRVSTLYIRPASADQFSPSPNMANHNQSKQAHAQRAQYNSPVSGYRGTSTASTVPYAFRSTPQLRNEHRTISALSPPGTLPLASDSSSAANRQRYPAPSSVSTTSSSSSSNPPSLPALATDNSVLFSNFQVPSLSFPGTNGVDSENDAPKPSPHRHRRVHKRGESNTPAPINPKPLVFEGVTASGMFGSGTPGPFQYNSPQLGVRSSPQLRPESAPSGSETKAQPWTNTGKLDFSNRYRRRSSSFGNSIETDSRNALTMQSGVPSSNGLNSPMQNAVSRQFPTCDEPCSQISLPQDRQLSRPASSGSNRNPNVSVATQKPVASAENARRTNNPSPLSRPLSGEAETVDGSRPHLASNYSTGPTVTQSPAVAAMAALHEKDVNKGVKSRLRRAFSFGTTTELKRATDGGDAIDRAKVRQEQFSNELDDEQDAIARKQEASGLGNSIYTGQGGVFSGSTDNLSISSTASSASLMLRKMGKGMKKGGRSIKGLFRPKSVIGVPAADGPSQASVGQVSMVTVEAEREHINVNPDPHDQAGGGTGFPRLERNSVDTARASTTFVNVDRIGLTESRRSVVGGDQERQDVLNAVKRGILKRTGTSSPSASPRVRPIDGTHDYPSPPSGLTVERRSSPVPSTTSSEPRRTGHRRTDSHTIEGDDYFASVPRVTGSPSSRSLPGTPRSLARNISFSPRIQFHDVWSSSEYDRRGEIATCNRLTPLLAQQIKEELNTFKMVSDELVYCIASSNAKIRKWKSTSNQSPTPTSSSHSGQQGPQSPSKNIIAREVWPDARLPACDST